MFITNFAFIAFKNLFQLTLHDFLKVISNSFIVLKKVKAKK